MVQSFDAYCHILTVKFLCLKRILEWYSEEVWVLSQNGMNCIIDPLGYSFRVPSYIFLKMLVTSSCLDFSVEMNSIFVLL